MVLRRARKIEAFDDFIGIGFQLSNAAYFRTMRLETFQFLKYGNLACIPTFHTTAPVFFTLRKLKIQAFKRLKNGEGKPL